MEGILRVDSHDKPNQSSKGKKKKKEDMMYIELIFVDLSNIKCWFLIFYLNDTKKNEYKKKKMVS